MYNDPIFIYKWAVACKSILNSKHSLKFNRIGRSKEFEIMNVRGNEISKVSYLFPQIEDKRDICYLENSNGSVIFIFSLNKFYWN